MYRPALLFAGLAAAIPAQAQDSKEVVRLARLVEAQQARIARLEARLAAVEATTPPPAPVTTPVPVEVAALPAASQRRTPAPLGQALPSDAHPPSLEARIARIESAQKDSVHVDWSKGTPEFTSASGNFTFRPHGRLLLDWGTTAGSEVANRNISATQARSLRIGIEGSIGRNLSYLLEGDFADNEVAIKSAHFAWTTAFLGQQAEFAVGNRLNDRGLDGSSGTISVPFLERNMVAQGIIPARGFFGLGAAARIYGKRWHVGLQLSGDDISNPGTASDGMTIGARAHWNPVMTDDVLVHTGVWGFRESLADDLTRPTRSIAVGGFYNDNLRISPGSFTGAKSGQAMGSSLACSTVRYGRMANMVRGRWKAAPGFRPTKMHGRWRAAGS